MCAAYGKGQHKGFVFNIAVHKDAEISRGLVKRKDHTETGTERKKTRVYYDGKITKGFFLLFVYTHQIISYFKMIRIFSWITEIRHE